MIVLMNRRFYFPVAKLNEKNIQNIRARLESGFKIIVFVTYYVDFQRFVY